MEDKISVIFTFSAVMMAIYLQTFYGNLASFDIATTLAIAGISLQYITWGKIKQDRSMSGDELTKISTYALIGFTGMMVAAVAIPKLFVSASMGSPLDSVNQLSVSDQIIHGQMYAIAEEVFFRGAVLGLVLWIVPTDLKLGKVLGIKINIKKEYLAAGFSAIIFALYHLAVYGFSSSTMYVFVAGLILGLITVVSKRLSPAMLAHQANNLIAVLLTVWGLTW